MAIALLFVLYCFEAGVFFVVVPWTRFWAYNPLLHSTPLIAAVTDNLYFRGFVTGFGLVHFLVGFREIAAVVRRRRETRTG